MKQLHQYASGYLDINTPGQARRHKQQTISTVVRGCVDHLAVEGLPAAEYHEPRMPELRGNPFIAALRIPQSEGEILKAFNRRPAFDKKELKLPAFERAEYVERLEDFRHSSTRTLDAMKGLLRQLVRGYRGRNCLEKWGRIQAHGRSSQVRAGQCSMLYGLSGMGKTTIVEAFQEFLGAQAVMHHDYRGQAMERPQIKYLIVVVHPEMTPQDFCRAALFAIDKVLGGPYGSQYLEGRWAASDLTIALQAAFIANSVGMLIVEECQNFYTVHNNRRIIADHVVALRELCKIPIVMVGTPLFHKVLTVDREYALARRLVEGGNHHLPPPPDEFDEDWQEFLAELWKYQWLQNPGRLDQTMATTFFECSRGIRGLAVSLFKHAQITALDLGEETLTEDLVKDAYQERMQTVHPAVEALKNGDISQYEDLVTAQKKGKKNEQRGEGGDDQLGLEARPRRRRVWQAPRRRQNRKRP